MKLAGKSFMQMSSGFHHTRAGFVPFWVRINEISPRYMSVIYTVKSWFFKAPRETKIGSKNQRVCQIGGKITVFICGRNNFLLELSGSSRKMRDWEVRVPLYFINRYDISHASLPNRIVHFLKSLRFKEKYLKYGGSGYFSSIAHQLVEKESIGKRFFGNQII